MRPLLAVAGFLLLAACASHPTHQSQAAAPSGSAPAGEMMAKDGTMMMMEPNGKMTTMQMSDPNMSEMGKMMEMHGQVVAPNTMMMMYNGKMYMMQDMKMSNGKMMSDMMKMQ
jgi:hypothetical protein